MEHSPEDPRLAACIAVDLECPDCVKQAASSVVAVCGARDAAGIDRIFHLLYPESACHAMREVFHASCDEELAAAKQDPPPLTRAVGA